MLVIFRLMNNVPSVETMANRNDYHLFKEGIKPAWEDPVNVHGASFTITCNQGNEDKLWINSVLACIGTQFEQYDHICGISFAKRDRGSRISLWFDTTNAELMAAIKYVKL